MLPGFFIYIHAKATGVNRAMKTHRLLFGPLLAALLLFTGFLAPTAHAPAALQPVSHPGSGSALRVLLLPLDSRPPCTDFVVDLARLAGMEVLLPPPWLLDHYRRPAETAALAAWLREAVRSSRPDAVIVSADMLVHGSLLASRQRRGQALQEQELLQLLTALHAEQPRLPLYAFSIIPRLLLADSSPHGIYQYHLKKYSLWADEIAWFDNPNDVASLLAMEKRLPAELKRDYAELYARNLAFNRALIDLAASGALKMLVLGQDDGFPFGLPNQEKEELARYAAQRQAGQVVCVTRGTDEVALSLLGRLISLQRPRPARVEVRYSSAAVAGMLMPYMPHSVATTVAEKMALAGTVPAAPGDTPDLLLYVHAGRKGSAPWEQLAPAREVASLLRQGAPVALMDLSEDFSALNTLYPWLVLLDAPLERLTAYAGWNTTSNSLGTILTHALAVLSGQASPQQRLEALGERLLDDWYYQKTVQGHLNRWLAKKRDRKSVV